MNIKTSLLALVLAFVFLSAAGQQKNKKSNFKVVGYYSLNAAMTTDLKTAPFDLLTHINLWFLNPSDTLTGAFNQDYSRIIPFVKAAHAKGVKVLASIAGGTRHKYYHPLLEDNNRARFIQNLLLETLKYDLDGIDVDIEGADIDTNYERFVVGLARTLRSQDKMITSALTYGTRNKLTDLAMAQYDIINIMSYDQTGSWRPDRPGPHSTYERAVSDLEYFATERKIPREKLTLGVPFYGYSFGPELTSRASSMNFRQIVTSFPGAEQVDQWTLPTGAIVYYNGIPTMKKKVELAKEKASGIMIWQVLGDATGDLSLLKLINDVGYKK
jgi:GH18 family chitinase